jgi:hypothetical protein
MQESILDGKSDVSSTIIEFHPIKVAYQLRTLRYVDMDNAAQFLPDYDFPVYIPPYENTLKTCAYWCPNGKVLDKLFENENLSLPKDLQICVLEYFEDPYFVSFLEEGSLPYQVGTELNYQGELYDDILVVEFPNKNIQIDSDLIPENYRIMSVMKLQKNYEFFELCTIS